MPTQRALTAVTPYLGSTTWFPRPSSALSDPTASFPLRHYPSNFHASILHHGHVFVYHLSSEFRVALRWREMHNTPQRGGCIDTLFGSEHDGHYHEVIRRETDQHDSVRWLQPLPCRPSTASHRLIHAMGQFKPQPPPQKRLPTFLSEFDRVEAQSEA